MTRHPHRPHPRPRPRRSRPDPDPVFPTPEPEPTTFVLEGDSWGEIPSTITDGVLEWQPFQMTQSSGFHITLKSSDDNLPAQAGGNGNYFVRVERVSGSDSEITISPTCLEFPVGGGASAGHRIGFTTQGYYSFQGKSAEFSVYETTGETGCTNVRETTNPVFTPGKIVVNASAHPPLTLPDQIEINEGETHNTTGLPALAPDFDNRVKVRVTHLGDGDVSITPTEFWIEPGNYDLDQWPNLQITAATDADMANDQAWFSFDLTDRGRYLTSDSFKVVVSDTTEPLTPATGGTTTFVLFFGSLDRVRYSTTTNGLTEWFPFTMLVQRPSHHDQGGA